MTDPCPSCEFMQRDYNNLDRSRLEAHAEVDALRTLVADMIKATVPILIRASRLHYDPASWQHRAIRAAARCPISG